MATTRTATEQAVPPAPPAATIIPVLDPEAADAAYRILAGLAHNLATPETATILILADAMADAGVPVAAEKVRVLSHAGRTADFVCRTAGFERCPICAPVWFAYGCRGCDGRRVIPCGRHVVDYNLLLFYYDPVQGRPGLRENAPEPTHVGLSARGRHLVAPARRRIDAFRVWWEAAGGFDYSRLVVADMAVPGRGATFDVVALRDGVLMSRGACGDGWVYRLGHGDVVDACVGLPAGSVTHGEGAGNREGETP